MEIWKDIKGFQGQYKISDLGRVKSLKLKTDKLLAQTKNSCGYYHVSLCLNGIKKNFLVHQLVAKEFLNYKPDPYKIVVNHKNINRLDNRLENLEIITHRKNCNRAHLNNASKYTGVSIVRSNENIHFISRIVINKKQVYLGISKDEYKMSEIYNIALDNIQRYNNDNRSFKVMVYDKYKELKIR